MKVVADIALWLVVANAVGLVLWTAWCYTGAQWLRRRRQARELMVYTHAHERYFTQRARQPTSSSAHRPLQGVPDSVPVRQRSARYPLRDYREPQPNRPRSIGGGERRPNR